MTRHLYDIAVITDYSRRKRNVNEETNTKNQLSARFTQDTIDPINSPVSQQTKLCQTPNPLLSVCDAGNTHNVAKAFDCETAYSISGYSSVGTVSGSNLSSQNSLQLANVLWNQNTSEKGQLTTLSQSHYETCKEDNGSMSNNTSVHANVELSPSNLQSNRRKKTSMKRSIIENKYMYFNGASTQEKSKTEDNVNVECAHTADPQWVWPDLQDGCAIQRNTEENENEKSLIEANLKRVSIQLYKLSSQVMLSPGTSDDVFDNGDFGSDKELPGAGFHDIPNSIQSNLCQDMHWINSHPSCNSEDESDSTEDHVWFTADSEYQTISSNLNNDSCNSHNNIGTHVSNTDGEQWVTFANCSKDHVKDHSQYTATAKEGYISCDVSNGLDVGIDVGDVTNQTTDATHVSFAQTSLVNGSGVRHKELARTQAGAMAVNDSGYVNSILSQNTTNYNTPFKHDREVIPDSQINLPFEGDRQIHGTQCKQMLFEKYQQDIYRKPIAAQGMQDIDSPYSCKVYHGQNFMDFATFLTSNCLPEQFLTEKNVFSLISISQRIVRIRVHKSYQPSDPRFDKNILDHGALLNINRKDATPENNDTKGTDHYGTGFAFYVDSEHIEVRTHSRLVSSAHEAEKTEIQFTIYVPDKEEWFRIDCMGQAQGFQTNVHSHTSIITCATPVQLKSLLHIFPSIPIQNRLSIFDDSNYFNDSSPKAHFFTKERAGNPLCDEQRNNVHTFNENESTSSSISCTQSIASDLSFMGEEEHNTTFEVISFISDSTDNDENNALNALKQSHYSQESIDLGYYENIENPFEYCRVDESVVKDAFESVLEEEEYSETVSVSSSSPNNVNGGEIQVSKGNKPKDSTDFWKLVASLDRQDSLFKSTSNSTPSDSDAISSCYDLLGIKGYQLFNNYAGDILGSLMPTKPGHLCCSIFDLPLGQWDYESMLYVQNQRRDEYNIAFETKGRDFARNTHLYNNSISPSDITPDINMKNNRNTAMNSLDFSGSQHQAGLEFYNQFQPENDIPSPLYSNLDDVNVNQCSESDSWDTDLLGLDLKLLCTPDVDVELEKLVEDILSDDLNEGLMNMHSTKPFLTEAQNKRPDTALIVSFPHGGFKQISHGKLSMLTKAIPGGELYDAPTCLGSCGAPVLCFNDNNDLYLTTFVHNGTAQLREKGLYQGFGVSHLPQSINEYSQCRPI